MRHESPLYGISIECPVCREVNTHDAIRVGSYVEEGRDTDFCPMDRRWHHSEYNAINPLVYSMATCQTCHYTRELDGKYKNWQQDPTFKLYRQKQVRDQHLGALGTPGHALKRLGTHLDVRLFPHETAINKLLLGIIDEQVVPQKGSLNVARYYLRIAWVFREMGSSGESDSAAWVWRQGLRDRIRVRREEWEKWLDQSKALAHSISEYTGHDIPFVPIDKAGSLVEDVLEDWLAKAAEPQPGGHAPHDTSSYFEFANFTDFLLSLRDAWDEVPVNEHEAILIALRYYIEFFEHIRTFSSPEQEIQTTYLIGELARRSGNTDVSSKYFNHAIRKGHSLLNELKHEVKRTAYIQNLVEISLEQGKKNREAYGAAV
jgi:hypothetical protein